MMIKLQPAKQLFKHSQQVALLGLGLCTILMMMPHTWAETSTTSDSPNTEITVPEEDDMTAPDTLQAGVHWNDAKAKAIAFRHLERQIRPHFFETQPKSYFDSVKACEDNPDLKFSKCQTTEFPDGAYSQAFEGEKMAYYYDANGTLFKVSVCDLPFGKDYNYPRRCVEYGIPKGEFQTISLDVSPEESYTYNLKGELIQHWKDEQGFSAWENTNWERTVPE